ncbi:MAG: hypothetical protein WBD45_24120 [Terriglobales bacterium]
MKSLDEKTSEKVNTGADHVADNGADHGTAKDAANLAANNGTNKSTNSGMNGKNGNDQSKFDWVTLRSACTLAKVFATLRRQVEEDVKTRNAQRPNYAPYEFTVADDIDAFTVFLKAKDLSRSVSFKLSEHGIAVQDDQGSSKFQVRVNFNDVGECRLLVDEQDREFWQVRRMALEDLMFRQE